MAAVDTISTTSSSSSEESDSDNEIELKLENPVPPSFFGNIEVNDSAEVHFGNTAVYNGPIIVNQIINDDSQLITSSGVQTINETTLSITDTININTNKTEEFTIDNPSSQSNNWFIKNKKIFITITIFITLLLSLTIVFILLYSSNCYDDVYCDEHQSIIGGQAPYYKRIDWSAQSAKDYEPFRLKQLNLVIVSHTTTPECLNKSICISQVHTMQDNDIISGFSDIKYNFLIGGDGGIYQGRGWNVIGALTNNSYDNISISIGVIGKFKYTLPNQKQLNALKIFLNDSVGLNKLSSNYSLLAHRQVTNNYNPGRIFFNELKKWSHWSNIPNQPQEYINGSLGAVPYYNKETWLMREVKEIIELKNQPLEYVIILHTVVPSECLTEIECGEKIRQIQKSHMEERHWPDIAYNFLIGSEGGIYEGRGWDTKGAHAHIYNRISIGVAIIGNFMYKLPYQEQIKALKLLIEKGVELKKISKKYKLLAHCQISETKSPGKKLYEELTRFPHWEPLNKEKCTNAFTQ